MEIKNEQEFFEALDACKEFAPKHRKDADSALLCVANYGEQAAFVMAGIGRNIVAATCCCLDQDKDFRYLMSAVAFEMAKANPENSHIIAVKPNKTKS